MEAHPHRRFDPLYREWVLVSPQRMARPWQGAVEPVTLSPEYVWREDCPLCPRAMRANGEVNPDYQGPFVFPNDFPALLPAPAEAVPHPLFQAESVSGECRVICYAPEHNASLGSLGVRGVSAVVDVWSEQYSELIRRWEWVQIFENRGEMMGCSNPHPHGQIWAQDRVPSRPARLGESYLESPGLLSEIISAESGGERVVIETADWLVWVPFWAAWPFEVMVAPKRPAPSLAGLAHHEREELAAVLVELLRRYDRLFGAPFPYSFGWMNAPASFTGSWHLFGQYFPPLLRSATVRKHMVGYELLCEAQRDLTPESAAGRLRAG